MKFENSNATTTSQNGYASKEKSKNEPMHSSQLMKLFEAELKDIYWVSKALTTAIPKMIKNTTSPELINALTSHLAEAENQVARVEEVFETLNKKATSQNCEAMEGLIKKAGVMMESREVGRKHKSVNDSAVQKEESYDNVSYGRLRQYVETLGLTETETLIESTVNSNNCNSNKAVENKPSKDTYDQSKKWVWPYFL